MLMALERPIDLHAALADAKAQRERSRIAGDDRAYRLAVREVSDLLREIGGDKPAQPTTSWFALRVDRSGMAPRPISRAIPQFAIQQILRNRIGLRAFCPAEIKLRPRRPSLHRRINERFLHPILPGLAFVWLSEPVNWWKLIGDPCTNMVHGVFSLDGKAPYAFSRDDMRRIFAFSAGLQDEKFYAPKPKPQFEVGEFVKVSWLDSPVKLVGYDNAAEKAKIEVVLFGGSRVVEADVAKLGKVG
jgi:transcription antitermination factor NusG